MPEIDWRAVTIGAAAALVLAFPAALIGAIVVDSETNNAVWVFLLLIMAGVLTGGFVAGSKRPDAPLAHGALAGSLGYLVAQIVTVAVRALDGSDLRSPVVYVFNLLLMASLGIVGAMIADRRNTRFGSTTS